MPDQDNLYYNKTGHSIKNDTLRYTWTGYFQFVIASSFIGDTTILIASIKYRVFRLHKVITATIQHMAFCDLMVSAMDVLPKLLSLISGDCVLGNFLCYLTAYGTYYFNAATVLLICIMTTSKLLVLKYPFRSRTVSTKKAHMICMACWGAVLIFLVTPLLVDWHDIYFSYRSYQCVYGRSSETWNWLKPLVTAIFGFLPICLVVVNTIFLLIAAKQAASRSSKSMKWQGIITTLLVAVIYCISVLPFLLLRFVKVDDISERISSSFLCLNTISNFYIYSLTVDSFRHFVRSRIHMMYRFLICNTGASNKIAPSTVIIVEEQGHGKRTSAGL